MRDLGHCNPLGFLHASKWGTFMRLKKSVSLLFCTAILIFASALPFAASAENAQDNLSYNGPAVTFEQIYANPDDQELNLNYARQQAAQGDLLSAASTLERLLFISPNWDSARLFYALVLYQLDDRSAAKRELALLDNRSLSPTQRTQANAYRKAMEEPPAKGDAPVKKFSGRLSVGVRYDDNVSSSITDTLLNVVNSGDEAVLVQASLNYTTPLGTDGLKFNAGVSGLANRHQTFSSSDYDTFAARAGLSGELSDSLLWAVDAQVLQVNISSEKYLTQLGGRLSLTKSLNEQTKIWMRGAWYDQDYNDLPTTAQETTRSGEKITLTTGVSWRLENDVAFSLSAGYEDKSATNPAFAYDGIRVNGRAFKGFDSGLYLKARATYRMLKYDGTSFNNPGPTRREDDHISGRVSGGASLYSLGNWMGMNPGEKFENLFLETSVNFTDRSSNNPALNYENIGTDVKLIWSF